jgi:hypothetical protein
MERRLGLARYRTRSTFRHRWGGYLALIVLLDLVGGLGLGSLAAARRTQPRPTRRTRRCRSTRTESRTSPTGFVRRQLAAAVAWQATVAAAVGIVVGIPLGLVIGRWLWDLFAQQIGAVPYPTVSVPSVVLVALGTVLLANLVATVPARTAARTPTALVLRAE